MLRAFLEKAAAALHSGYHLLIVDLWPPGRWDPGGIHAAWEGVPERWRRVIESNAVSS